MRQLKIGTSEVQKKLMHLVSSTIYLQLLELLFSFEAQAKMKIK
jgi:hypothetical protein